MRNVRTWAYNMLWKLMLVAGLAMIIGATVLGTMDILSVEMYSLEFLFPNYIGFLFIFSALTKILKRNNSFLVMYFLGSTAFFILAIFDIIFNPDTVEVSVVKGSIIFMTAVAIISFIILVSFKSLSKKRKIYQSFSFLLFNLGAFGIIVKHLVAPGLNCYACPWASAGCPIGLLQNWVIMGEVPYYLLGSSFTIFALFGRAFCGWACPFGFLHDIMNKVTSVKYKRSNVNVLLRGGARDPTNDRVGILTYVTRTAVFIAMIYFAWSYAETWFCKLCPAGFIEAALPYRLTHSVAPDPLFVFRIVVFFTLIMVALIVSRFWCRYFCPLGHLAGHFNRFSLLRLELDEEKCNKCVICSRACPMELNPEFFLRKELCGESDLFTKAKCMIKKEQSNCILCGECVEKCNRDALSISFLPSVASKRVKMAEGFRDKFFGEIQSSSTKLIKNVQHELEPVHRRKGADEDLTKDLTVEKVISRPPAKKSPPMRRQVQEMYDWAFPVSIYVFYRSVTEIPLGLDQLSSNPNYRIHHCNIFDDDKYSSFYYSHYKGFLETPVLLVNGQIYLGPLDDNNEILQFVDSVQDSYKDIYLYCNCENCFEVCKGDIFRRAIGDMELVSGEQYPLKMFKVQSPGAILSSCPPGALYALYGKSSQSSKKISDHIKFKMREQSGKDLYSFKEIPITTMEIYMKKDNDLSNELLNTVSRASYQSGGKLRYSITEWNKNVPAIFINGNELPLHNYPTSFYTLLTMVRKYSRI